MQNGKNTTLKNGVYQVVARNCGLLGKLQGKLMIGGLNCDSNIGYVGGSWQEMAADVDCWSVLEHGYVNRIVCRLVSS